MVQHSHCAGGVRVLSSFHGELLDRYALGVLEHVAFHSAYIPPPQRYLIALPEGRFAQFQDIVIKRKRTFVSYAMRPIVGGRVITGFLNRPRKTSHDGPWFVDLSERDRLKALRSIRGSLQRAWDGKETLFDDTALFVDPLTSPVPADLDDVLRRRAQGWAQ